MTASGACEMNWIESSGPATTPPSRSGFGSVLIGRSIPYELDGEAEVDYPQTGVRARFVVPSKHLHADEAAQAVRLGEADVVTERIATPQLGEMEFLLVEDQMLIAADVEAMLAEHGIAKVTTAPSVAEAMRQLKAFTPDVAILDVNLGSGTSLPIAEELVRRNVPFIFATGYSDRSIIPAHLAAPIVRKPYEAAALIAAVTGLFESR
jgi:CheY-like chemotaxis protein